MKLRFHKKLYARAAVGKAVDAFAPAAQIKTSVEGDHFVVEIDPEAPGDEAEVAGEFSNYVLGETIALRGDR